MQKLDMATNLDSINTVHKIGGKVVRHYDFWTSITQDRKILQILGGVNIPFMGFPPVQIRVPKPVKMSTQEKVFVAQKLIELRKMGCIQKLKHKVSGGWVSRIFLRPKKDNSYRLILDLSKLNKKMVFKTFCIDHIKHVCRMLKPGDQMCSTDLKSAYDHLRIHRRDQKYLRFEWEGDTYQYLVVPNGIQIGPHVFCWATSAITSFLRKLSIQIILYLDDSFVCSDSAQKLQGHMSIVIDTFEKAG